MKLKQLHATHVAEAHTPEQYPGDLGPEIALAGRSNVGKSSLLNTLCGKKTIARVSANPGRTRALHFFSTDAGFTLVDFPGYGFAQGPKVDRASWRKLIDGYLQNRPALRAVACLVDARHDPTADDIALMNWLNSLKINAICVATKADKLSGNEKAKNLANFKKLLKLNHDPVAFSSTTGEGREELVVRFKEFARAKV